MNKETKIYKQQWPWWPLLPLYPYGRRRTIFKELIPNELWSFEQLQGLYYVAVPVRLTLLKVRGGLMILNPLPPTKELLENISYLETKHGPVLTIVLPTASGLEHKISLPSLSRAFPKAELWICPGQWSFPLSMPLDWLGIQSARTNILLKDGVPHKDCCDWLSLGPLDIGLGRFQEISCFHKSTKSLHVTDGLVGIGADPPDLFDLDPTPLLFHSRDNGDEPLEDSFEARRKGWARLVLFASFLRPDVLSIPSIGHVLKKSFRNGLRNPRSHFGIFPFSWHEGWEESASKLIGQSKPLLQIAPVIERLIFPRAKHTFIEWLDEISSISSLRLLVPAHYNAPIECNSYEVKKLKKNILSRSWAPGEDNWQFLDSLDKTLLKFGVVPEDPLNVFRD